MIKPGEVWLDNRGKPIESHVGGVLYDNGAYYWYGMNWDGPTLPPDTLPRQAYTWMFNRGITVYRSTDLEHWEYLSTVLTEVSFAPGDLLQPLNALIRPKVLKCPGTGKFVLMAALISPDFNHVNDVVVAEADRPEGPFQFRGKLGWTGKPNETSAALWKGEWDDAATDAPERIRGFDMSMFQDADGKGYLLTSHQTVLLYELSNDYLSAKKVQKLAGPRGEAPAIILEKETYFLVCSQLTGWAPNQNLYWTAPALTGPWTARGPFAQGPKAETTFDSQTTFILPVADKPGRYIFMADNFHVISDREIKDMHRATHVWLPIDLDPAAQTLRVTWRDAWSPAEL
jgi:hypothetical protein